MGRPKDPSVHERWAHLRFSVIGQLLAAPPPRGELRTELKRLASCTWQHPVTGEPVRFALSTIERWLLRSRRERRDPVGVLRRKVRVDAGTQQVSIAIREALRAQYAAHPTWSVKLHYDNLHALAQAESSLVPVPSYSSIRRFYQSQGWRKRRRLTSRDTAGAERAALEAAGRPVPLGELRVLCRIRHATLHERLRVLTGAGHLLHDAAGYRLATPSAAA